MQTRGVFAGGALWGVGALLATSAVAQGAVDALPEPLTLEHALSLADAPHPDVRQARADVALASADRDAADALTGLYIAIGGRLRWVEPSDVAADQSSADHAAGLLVSKNLYDFGRSSAQQAASAAELEGSEWLYRDLLRQRRIAILDRFFAVLLADIEFALQDEAMAVAYVNLDRLRQRSELGQISDIVLLETESAYQRTRRMRAAAQARQRATRAELARTLNHPGLLPSTLEMPELPQLERELPEYEALVKRALTGNERLQALRRHVAAADERLAAARARYRPLLIGEFETNAYSRELGSYDAWRAGVRFEVPLYTGGVVDAAVARQQAEREKRRAQLEKAEQQVRQAILDAWLELGTLRVQLDETAALRDFRELYLDRSRAIYELEVKADLGDAMVRLTEAQLEAARTRFRTALAWERLDALTAQGPAGLPQ